MLFVVVDSEDSDWLAWLYPSPYTAAHRFDIVIMALDGVFTGLPTVTLSPSISRCHAHARNVTPK